MLKQRARLISGSLRLSDLGMLGVAFPVAYYLRDKVLGGPGSLIRPDELYPISTYWPLLAASLLVWQLAAWSTGIYEPYRTRTIATEMGRIARAFAILAVLIAAGQFVWKQKETYSRLFFGLYYGIAFAMLIGTRVALRVAAHAVRRRGYNTRAFAVVGSGATAEETVAAILSHAEWGYSFAGYVLEQGARAPAGAKVLGRLSEMGSILDAHVLDEVVFGVSRQRLDEVEEAVAICEEQGVGVKVLLDFFPNHVAKLSVEELDGIPVLSLSRTPAEGVPLVAKRIFDLAVSGLVLLVLSPLFLALAIAIKLDSPGPIFFRQRRVGLNGRHFWLYKFRSMCIDAEARLSLLKEQNEMDGPVFKMRRDPRVTAVGNFLRKTSLDEFPQFWNVLRGEMSVVGPRPPLPSEVRLYKRSQRRRLSVKPGITCIWQVSGRNEINFAEWMELDLLYIDSWSLWRDVKIVLRTIPAVILGKGAR
ncbi:MAG TPA: sugar transferase [Anaeromyxobacteraceae bacterium]|nr:sugar transferase [Anaeromyxobacteraceae bacterium]